MRRREEFSGDSLGRGIHMIPRRWLGFVGAAAVLLAGDAGIVAGQEKGQASKPGTVSIGGHAFNFSWTGGRLEGDEVTVLERPDLRTVTGERGAFRFDGLRPGSEISLIFKRDGYFTTQTATFTLGKEDIEDVSFQAPPRVIVSAYTMLLGYTPDPNRSQLATTVTRLGESMYGSHGPTHGERGATVTIDPPLPVRHGPIYFNLNLAPGAAGIIWPDRTLKETTWDGGVLFIDVPPGEYTLTAHKPGVKFEPVKVKCRAGVLTNASPPHGLQALNRLESEEEPPQRAPRRRHK